MCQTFFLISKIKTYNKTRLLSSSWHRPMLGAQFTESVAKRASSNRDIECHNDEWGRLNYNIEWSIVCEKYPQGVCFMRQ